MKNKRRHENPDIARRKRIRLLASGLKAFVVSEQKGGSVDTVRSVRQSRVYKNRRNQQKYDNRGEYDRKNYIGDVYKSMVRQAREKQAFIQDAYNPDNKVYYGNASVLGPQHRANLDHVNPLRKLHDDKVMYLPGVDVKEMANLSSNLVFTSEGLNKSKGDKTNSEYVERCRQAENPLPEKTAQQMLEKEAQVTSAMIRKTSRDYYTHPQFYRDMVSVGVKNGLKAAACETMAEVGLLVLPQIFDAYSGGQQELPEDSSFWDHVRLIIASIRTGCQTSGVTVGELAVQLGVNLVASTLTEMVITAVNTVHTSDERTNKTIRAVIYTAVQFLRDATYDTAKQDLREQLDVFASLRQEAEAYDVKTFEEKTEQYHAQAVWLMAADVEERRRQLIKAHEVPEIELPWQGDFDSFMSNPKNVLVF